MPLFTSPPTNVSVDTLGQSACLQCSYKMASSSDSPFVVRWFHDSIALESNRDGVIVDTDATTSKLTIPKLTDDLIGEYLVSIANSYGEIVATAEILLEGLIESFISSTYLC